MRLFHKLLNFPSYTDTLQKALVMVGVLVQKTLNDTAVKLKLFISQIRANKIFLLLLNSVVLFHVKLVVGLSHE